MRVKSQHTNFIYDATTVNDQRDELLAVGITSRHYGQVRPRVNQGLNEYLQRVRQLVDLGLGGVEVVADADEQAVGALDDGDFDALRPEGLAQWDRLRVGGQFECGHRAMQAGGRWRGER